MADKSQGNPFIGIPNPYEEYNKYVDKHLSTNSEAQTFAKLCYELFYMNNYGKELLEYLEERFIYSQNVHLNSAHPRDDALYWTGYTDLIKQFKSFANQHKKVIESCQKEW